MSGWLVNLHGYCALFFLLVATLSLLSIIVSLLRFHCRGFEQFGSDKTHSVHQRCIKDLLWALVPCILLIILAWPAIRLLFKVY